MTLLIDRRRLLLTGTFGLGALAIPGTGAFAAARGFTHNVASGEPRAKSVMLWTRYVSSGEGRLRAELSRTADFARIAGGGSVTADPDRDSTAKLVVDGLDPGQWYFYRFVAPDGSMSPVGRTRTLPDGPVPQFTLGVFSCSNLPFGWFNAYAHAAARDDIDLMVHLGDYFYEYDRTHYPTAGEALAGRVIEPASEIVSLADYRLRFASYRADADLQRLHQRFPMVAMWDDHESANDSWEGGAQNHQPDTEGDWGARKRASMRAYREWLPVTDDTAESYQIGDLATLFRPETRLTARSQQFTYPKVLADKTDVVAALTAFRDGPWQDPARTMMGAEQERWLSDGFKASVGQGTRWQVLGQQTVMGSASVPPELATWLTPDASEEAKQAVALGLAAMRAGLPFNLDSWDGYPAARQRLLRSALDADANLVVLSGDSHNAWAFDLDVQGTPAGVEFAGQSVTSPGYEDDLPQVPPGDLVRALVRQNHELKWADTSRRGYLTVTLTPERASGEWLFLDTIRQRSTKIAARHNMSATAGSNRFA